ncbi:hypothetical protein AAFF_G00057310 [Aldrovandia affinis]|uniref:Uncharacterized protein n=1 Tax=Aldrovandia affinis TaxID=143900 RepID=A0AAD7S316_9TELE|nr:hypothetical protein AAFF_G00057310 [Aldrovandia affinis]
MRVTVQAPEKALSFSVKALRESEPRADSVRTAWRQRGAQRELGRIYGFAETQQRSHCRTFRVRRSQTIYWKEGLLVTFDWGFLRFGPVSCPLLRPGHFGKRVRG